ncbi:MAG TPA: helix-turn-helix domain-containing protein [Pirellulales bacterium]|nr:helix-turn-helix domain-containing protein [Pirellulales bacterium]
MKFKDEWETHFPAVVERAAKATIKRKRLQPDRWYNELRGVGQLAYIEAGPIDEKTLYGIICTAMQRHIRAESREPQSDQGAVERAIYDPDAAAELEDDILASCDPLDAEIVRLRAAGYSRKEAAAELGIDPATVTRRLNAIKKRYFS